MKKFSEYLNSLNEENKEFEGKSLEELEKLLKHHEDDMSAADDDCKKDYVQHIKDLKVAIAKLKGSVDEAKDKAKEFTKLTGIKADASGLSKGRDSKVFFLSDGSSIVIKPNQDRIEYYDSKMNYITTYTSVKQAVKAFDQSGLLNEASPTTSNNIKKYSKYRNKVNESNVNRDVNGEKVKFDSKHLKDIREIMDTVYSNRNGLKMTSARGDWEVSIDISNDVNMYVKLATSYNLNQFDIDTKGNIVTLKAIKK